MKKNIWILILSIVLNLSLIVIIILKTNLPQRVGHRIGLIEMKAQDRPDFYCIRGWTNTLKKLNIDCDVVFFGNSITAGSSFHEYFPNVSICNLGYPGDELDGMLLRIGQIKAVNPEKIFIMAGINGLYMQSLLVFEDKYEKLLKAIKKENPLAKIYLQSILPVNNNVKKYNCDNNKIIDANNIIQSIAKENNCCYIDIHKLYFNNGELDKKYTKDGVHLKHEYYNMWGDLLKTYIEE